MKRRHFLTILALSPLLIGASRTFETIDLILDLAASREAVRELARTVDMGSVPSIAPARGWISSPFGPRVHPVYRRDSFHGGLDIANSRGTPVCATGGGVVVYAGSGRWYDGYGNLVIIEHSSREKGDPADVQTLVAHLDTIFVHEGDRVVRGDLLGTMGITGVVTGPHCHYEIRVNGIRQNPREWIL